MASQKKKRPKAVQRRNAKKTQKRAPVVRKSASPPKSKKSKKSPTSTKSKPRAPKKRAPKKSPTPKKRAPKKSGARPVVPAPLPVARPSPVMPERRDYDSALNASAQSFPETRYFTSANALMGYLEGRPGVVSLLTVIPSRGGERLSSGWTDATRREMAERLDASPPAQDAAEQPEYRAWRAAVMEALEWADDGGVVVEAEVDSDSEPSET